MDDNRDLKLYKPGDIDDFAKQRAEYYIDKISREIERLESHHTEIESRIAKRHLKWAGIIGATSIATLFASLISIYVFVLDASESAAISKAEEVATSQAEIEVEKLRNEFKQSSQIVGQLHTVTVDRLVEQIESVSEAKVQLAQVQELLPSLAGENGAKLNALISRIVQASDKLDSFLSKYDDLSALELRSETNQSNIEKLQTQNAQMSKLTNQKFKVERFDRAQCSGGECRVDKALLRRDQGACFLTLTKFQELDSDNDWAQCQVHEVGEFWTLTARRDSDGSNEEVRCEARCLRIPNLESD